jgi:radical SAM superfamily enzyme YgiQ (UPF0313 family)
LSHLEKELQVIEELFSPQTSSLLFVDDNLFLDEKFAFALMEMLKKSPFVFSTYTDIRLGENPQLLAAAAEAGLTHIFCGLESVVSSSLRPMSGLKGRLVTHYAQYIHNIQKAGVGVFGSFILGLDDDDQSTFANLEKFLAETPLYRASFGFLTPYPGTPLYERKRQEQRITSSNWSEYFEWNVVLDHPILTKQQLVEGVKNLYDFFYSKPMGLKRIRYFKSLKK